VGASTEGQMVSLKESTDLAVSMLTLTCESLDSHPDRAAIGTRLLRDSDATTAAFAIFFLCGLLSDHVTPEAARMHADAVLDAGKAR